MKPVYFPFTFISTPMAEKIHGALGEFITYQASTQHIPDTMRLLSNTDIIEVRLPENEKDRELDRAFKEYMAWADLHQGQGMAFFKTQGGSIPFFNESAPSKIRSDITGRKKVSGHAKTPSILFNACLYLLLAQHLDVQEVEAAEALLAVGRKEEHLFQRLHGVSEDQGGVPASDPGDASEDPGLYGKELRLAAWSYLMLNDGNTSGIYVTSSRSIFNYIIDIIDGNENDNRTLTIPLPLSTGDDPATEQKKLLLLIKGAVQKTNWPDVVKDIADLQAPAPGDPSAHLVIHIIPETTPQQFFQQFLPSGISTLSTDVSRGSSRNVIIAFLNDY